MRVNPAKPTVQAPKYVTRVKGEVSVSTPDIMVAALAHYVGGARLFKVTTSPDEMEFHFYVQSEATWQQILNEYDTDVTVCAKSFATSLRVMDSAARDADNAGGILYMREN